MSVRPLTGVDFTNSFRKSENRQPHSYERYTRKPTDVPRAEPKTEAPAAAPRVTVWTPLRMFLAFGVVSVMMTAWIWETTYVRTRLTEIERLKNERMEISKRNEALIVEIASLSAYERIEKIARDQLGMKPYGQKPGVLPLDPDLSEFLETSKK